MQDKTTVLKIHKGFTLIEIMVAVGISLLLTGSVFVGFNSFSSSQRLKQTALNFKNNLKLAQVKAQSGQKPTGCDSLVSYRVVFTSRSYIIRARCKVANNEVDLGELLQFDLPIDVTLSAYPPYINYKPLSAGIELPSPYANQPFVFQITNTSSVYSLRLNTNGEVDDLGIVQGGQDKD